MFDLLPCLFSSIIYIRDFSLFDINVFTKAPFSFTGIYTFIKVLRNNLNLSDCYYSTSVLFRVNTSSNTRAKVHTRKFIPLFLATLSITPLFSLHIQLFIFFLRIRLHCSINYNFSTLVQRGRNAYPVTSRSFYARSQCLQ